MGVNDITLKSLLLGDFGASPSAVNALAQNAGSVFGRDWAGNFLLGTQVSACNLQTFTSSGTWGKPSVGQFTLVFLVGAGAGGWSGQSQNGGQFTASGGAGGGGGGYTYNFYRTALLPNQVSVTVGAGGSGGPEITAAAGLTSSNFGQPGAAGGTSYFGDIATGSVNGGTITWGCTARGGTVGVNAQAAGQGGAGTWLGGYSGVGLTGAAGTAPTILASSYAAGGGGGGGGCTTAAAFGGGSGGSAGANTFSAGSGLLVGGSAGTSGLNGTSGSPGSTSSAASPRGGGGGGGGGAAYDAGSTGVTRRGGAGGNGATYGGGGGGGGAANVGVGGVASTNTAISGVGGTGGNGLVIVITW